MASINKSHRIAIPDILVNKYKKPIINVLVLLGEKAGGLTSFRKVDPKTKKISYTGFNWDVWRKISAPLKKKYSFKLHFTEPGKVDYNNTCKEINKGKYDICLGSFMRTTERLKLIDYCSPLDIDANAVIHLKDTESHQQKFFDIVSKLWIQIVGIFVMGLIFGLILFFFDKNRIKHQMQKNQHHDKSFFLRAIVTGIAAVFGEMGYLAERATLSATGIIISIILMTLSFLVAMYVQGEITTILVNQEDVSVNRTNLGDKPILGLDGYAVVKVLKSYGANIKYLKNKSLDDMIKIYLKNPKKYNGCGLSYADGYRYTKLFPLAMSLDFGYFNTSYVVSKKQNRFRNDVDQQIAYLKTSGKIHKICISYFGDIKKIPVCKLR